MASNPSPETAPESGAALWLAVGRLQSDTARLIEGQGNLRADLAETNRRSDETNRRIDETNRGIDRLFYAIVGVGAGVIGTLVAVLMRSG
jgi:hypothetical protein